MKYYTFIFLSILLLPGNAKTQEEDRSDMEKIAFLEGNKKLIFDSGIIDATECNFDFKRLFDLKINRKLLEFPSFTTKQRLNIMNIYRNYSLISIDKIEPYQEVKIIGKLSQYKSQKLGRDYFLVRKLDNKSWWIGFTDKESIPPTCYSDVNLLDINDHYKSLELLSSSDYMVLLDDLTNSGLCVIVIKRTSPIISVIPIKAIQNLYSETYAIRILDISSDQKYIWFRGDYDTMYPSTTCFILYDIITKKYELFRTPPDFGDEEYLIDYKTGDIVYSNILPVTASDSGKQYPAKNDYFVLYFGNLFSNTFHEIARNKGYGFDLFMENGSIKYKIRTENKP